MIKRATVTTWAEWFEKHEGVRVGYETIQRKLSEAGRIGVDGRNRIGRLLTKRYFSEADVREACAEVLRPLPQCDKRGLVDIDGIRHGTVKSLALLLGISEPAIQSRLASSGVKPVHGKDKMGHPANLWPEPWIQGLCADLLDPGLFQVGKDGFVVINGVRHGTFLTLARNFGVSPTTLSKRLVSADVKPVKGKMRGGQLRDLWPEPVARDLCADLLDPGLFQVDDEGFLIIDGIRYGTGESFTRILRISASTILSRLACSGVKPVHGKGKMGHPTNLYPEPAVRELCKDLIETPKVGMDGFVEINGIRYGSIRALCRLIGRGVESRVRKSDLIPVSVRGLNGKKADFYPEPTVRELCKDLIEKRKPNKG